MPWYNHPPNFADPETGAFAEDFQGIVGNFPAMAAGDAGAPRIFQGALERLVAGNDLRATVSASASATDMAATASYSFGVVQGGSIRVVVTGSGSPAPVTNTITRVRGGATTTIVTTGTNPISADVDVLPGDSVSVSTAYGGGTGAATATVTATISTAGQDLYPAPGLFGFLVNNRALA
jgi:hypothetical protein